MTYQTRYGAFGYAAIGINRYARKRCGDAFTHPGRGRGESLTSPRRIAAKLRANQALKMRLAGYTWRAIARALGYKCPSGAWRAVRRACDRVDAERYGKSR